MEPQPKLEQILDQKILMYMAYRSSFGETIMMNFLATEANMVNQYGRSTSNQRIEFWWSIYKRDTIQKYLDYFKHLRDCGQYDDTDNVHVEALKFSFYGVIQDDLDNLVDYWNNHKIRTSKLSESPDGRPSVIYELPEKYDAEDRKIPVNTVDLNLAKRLYSAAPSQFCCSDEFSELALMIMEDLNLQIPSSFKEVENLYFKLVEEIGKLRIVHH